MAKLATGIEAYGLILDNLLKYDKRTLKVLTNLYGLIYKTIISNDSWCMTNGPLQELLLDRDGAELLRNGIIVPLRRDSVDSFSLFRTQCEEKKMTGLCATEDFAKFLDLNAKTRIFPMKEVAASYAEMSHKVLEPQVLMAFGISEASAMQANKIIQEAKGNGIQVNTNTFIYEQVKPLLPANEQELLMEIARAPYALNLPSLIGSGIVGPQGFRGDAILAALRGSYRQVASLDVTTADQLTTALYSAKVSDALVNWLFSEETLANMTAEQLLAARSTSNRQEYLDAQVVFLEKPSQDNWNILVPAMTAYFKIAAEEVFRIWKLSRFGAEPGDGSILIEGDHTIKIVTPDKPVQLRGVVDSGEDNHVDSLPIKPMQVVGSTYALPEPTIR